jgi:HEAT repeat protein
VHLRTVIVAIVLGWPAPALGQNPTQALLDTIHDEETLVAGSQRFFYELSPRDGAALRRALDNKNPYVRWGAAMMLVGDGRKPDSPELAVPVLVDAIKHGGPEVRKAAFQRLGSLSFSSHYADICAPVIDEDVIAGMEDPAVEVNDGATHAISACPSLPVSIAAREIAASRGRLLLIRNLSQRGPEAKPASDALIAALRDEQWDVRLAATETLRSAGVAPELYVPLIVDDIANSEDESARGHAVEQLIAVGPAAARWAPDIIRTFRSERSPFIRKQLQVALHAIGTPETRRAASYEMMKETAAASAPVIVFVAVTAVVSVLIMRGGWGVLLGFLFPVLSLIGFVLDDNGSPLLPLAIVAAPVFSLGGAIAGVVFARRAESEKKRRLGLLGAGLSVVALLFNGLIIFGLIRFFSAFGAG